MRQNPSFTLASEDGVKHLIREHPWMTIVSMTDAAGLVASHYPVLLDETADGIVLLTHVGQPDDIVHELGRHEVLVIVQGPHGYISPGWYDANPAVPTWNFVTAHLHGTPELLDADENLRVLEALVDHFEDAMPEPRRMRGTTANSEYADRIATGTVGLRIPISPIRREEQDEPEPARRDRRPHHRRARGRRTVREPRARRRDAPHARGAAGGSPMTPCDGSHRRRMPRSRRCSRVPVSPERSGLFDLHLDAGVIATIAPAVPSRQRPSARDRIDLDGRWVFPGLHDRHVHFSQWAMVSRRLDLAGADSAAAVAALVAASVDRGAT